MDTPFHNQPGSARDYYRDIPDSGAGDEESLDSADPNEVAIVVETSEDFSQRGWKEPPIRIGAAR